MPKFFDKIKAGEFTPELPLQANVSQRWQAIRQESTAANASKLNRVVAITAASHRKGALVEHRMRHHWLEETLQPARTSKIFN